MARRGRDRILHRRRRRPQAAHDDNRISALSDDLLLVILRRLDTRTALGAGLFSRRWARLVRELPAIDFRVDDILPPRYRRLVHLHRASKVTDLHYIVGTAKVEEAMPDIRRHERRAMRALTSSVENFLGAQPADDILCRRKVNRLRVEFFATNNTGCINRLITKAIDAWGLDDLEAIAKPIYWQNPTIHAFPSQGLCEEQLSASRLRSLKLGGCMMLPPLHQHGALTTLVLQDLPMSTPESAYEGIFTSCPQLQVLHLISCQCVDVGELIVDAPMSEMRELVVDKCDLFTRIGLWALPRLERLASLGTRVRFESTSFPCLRQCNIALCLGDRHDPTRQYFASRTRLKLGMFLGCTPDITDLVIRFTGADRWIGPSSSSPSSSMLPSLRRLLIADVPRSWDVSWPRLLLETAPCLEILHIHIALPGEEEDELSGEIPWQPTMLAHHHLREFVMVGFEGTVRQLYLVRFVLGVCCTALRHVGMFKKGQVRDKGHWDWEMVTQQHSEWTDEEKDNTLKQIMTGIPSCSSTASQFQLVLV
ncbi:uncharacterized protein LOC100834383 [Brachypodium distachyon]|uniref:F-box domain-containing protein n=1 Tax=Brachypodium distachyon TaxID=15368 RepID=A0A0Q3GS12_BRADI|nr:uncharacterized protein LOC100834383 [Brachypodium distachyon]KQJ83786.1 hypothetical protein BRADI_5g16845v3 [Brachypodium distachyon]|eukprot:XP_003581461.1 uncharacterized protein LOC100834383 [Brachypodium distachyon]